jgi:hypothetical protein
MLEGTWLLLLDKVPEVTDVGVLCDLGLKYIPRATSDDPTVELEIGRWNIVSN